MDKNIKFNLLKEARELFIKKGFKSTGIREIAKKTGVATGTLYNYYDSKEDIFLDIFLEENDQLNKEIIKSLNIEEQSLKILKKAISNHLEKIEENPILKVMFETEVRDKVLSKLKPNKYKKYTESTRDTFIPYIKNMQDKGIVKNIDPEFFIIVINTIYNVNINKKEYGEEYFPMLTEFLIEAIINNLKK
ncbi:TetR/AcrR family transcriptional regulator [Dethiothermospora halolimnae]|uniref:TetR/AcrR family transcriptional regulator n=1 Tax=Dethiothermospora halolimnae TaxID=3114390 RepID=UPI003CCC0C9C